MTRKKAVLDPADATPAKAGTPPAALSAESSEAAPVSPQPHEAAGGEAVVIIEPEKPSEDRDRPVELSYRVLSPLRHDGERYKPGDLVPLLPEMAVPLLKSGVLAAWTMENV